MRHIAIAGGVILYGIYYIWGATVHNLYVVIDYSTKWDIYLQISVDISMDMKSSYGHMTITCSQVTGQYENLVSV